MIVGLNPDGEYIEERNTMDDRSIYALNRLACGLETLENYFYADSITMPLIGRFQFHGSLVVTGMVIESA